MAGSGARRHCGACDREVLDLSAMHAEAAIEALIARAGRACIRYQSDAAGEVLFAPPPPRRAGPLAAAARALSACAGWADDPAPVPPGELGMCIPDSDDANACAHHDAPGPAQSPPGATTEPSPDPPATDRDYTAQIDIMPTAMGDSSGVSLADLQTLKSSPSDSDGVRLGMLVIVQDDPTKSLFDRESTAGPGRDWWATARLLRMKRQLRREERQRRREARQR